MGGRFFDFERISGDSIHITRRLLKSPFNDFDIKLADFGFVRTPASCFSRGRGIARVAGRRP